MPRKEYIDVEIVYKIGNLRKLGLDYNASSYVQRPRCVVAPVLVVNIAFERLQRWYIIDEFCEFY
jgi:hypothetical protein